MPRPDPAAPVGSVMGLRLLILFLPGRHRRRRKVEAQAAEVDVDETQTEPGAGIFIGLLVRLGHQFVGGFPVFVLDLNQMGQA